jgi:tRNA 2-thiouridine synthesizing protein A
LRPRLALGGISAHHENGGGRPVTVDDSAVEPWDAGHMGCGELVVELRFRVGRLRAGQVLELIALDPGTRAEVPAWCRMTGHTLLSQEPPVYRIRREES